jgi:hypothetical protein
VIVAYPSLDYSLLFSFFDYFPAERFDYYLGKHAINESNPIGEVIIDGWPFIIV